jgi:hypothetical protein
MYATPNFVSDFAYVINKDETEREYILEMLQYPVCRFRPEITSYWGNGTQFDPKSISFKYDWKDLKLVYRFVNMKKRM